MEQNASEQIPHMSPDEFAALGHRMVDWIADYWRQVERYPVLSRAKPGEVPGGLPLHAPERGLGQAENNASAPGQGLGVVSEATPLPPPSGRGGWDSVFRDLEEVILPGITHWQSPNFFAYFPANASGPAVLAELLSAGLGVQGMLWATSPACTELETRVLDWLGEMIGLPAAFLSSSERGGGVIQGTASEATLVAMLAAKQRIGGGGPLVVYTSTQAHSSIIKAAMIAGIASGSEDREHVRLIEVDDQYRMRPEALERAMREDVAAGKRPFFVCATVGTTSSGAVDSIGEIAKAVSRSNLPPGPIPGGGADGAWIHVDAAWAGAACVCPEFRGTLDGIEQADSIAFNPHKWLLTNFDCNCFWTRDRRALTDALSVTPEYLRNAASDSGQVIDYRDWQVPLGRRFRSLKLWFVIRHYGVEGLRAYIREHVRLAALFEEWVRADERFELAAPRSLSLVCFRLRGEGADGKNRHLLERINASGRAYLTHTVLSGRVVLRMAIGAAQTKEEHVRGAWDLIQELA
jgi:aromatic-L-amino-acid decarboxylase